MPAEKLDFAAVSALARALGEVQERPDSLRVGGKLWAWLPPGKNAEPGSLAVWLDLDRRAELIDEAPEVYYVTKHYLKYPTVLVRLDRIDREALQGLLAMSRELVAGAAQRAKPLAKRRAKPRAKPRV